MAFLGDARHSPFRLNPFYFDPGTSLKQHISVLADAMGELLPVEALIAPKLREAAELCYRECGWDIESGRFLGISKPEYPDMIRFNLAVHDICRTFEDYGPEVRANYKGALLNRARIFIDDLYQDIFAVDGNRPFDDLFDRDTIIEMEEMPPSEINMPAFIISMVLQRLRAHRFRVQAEIACLKREGREADAVDLGRRYPPVLLVVEEAHNVLHRKFEQERSEREAGKGKRLVEQVGRLMMEGRALGIGVMVVDQSPKNLADAVIANTNTKLVFRQEDGDEVKAIGTALGIPEKDWPDLQRLADGECVVKSKGWSSPVKLAGLEECPPEVPHATAYTGTEPPRYGEALRQLDDQGAGWAPSPSAARPLAKRLLRVCDDRMDLVRFILGKHWIESGDHHRARRTIAIADYGALVRHLQTCAKPSAEMAEFLKLLGAVFLGMSAVTIRDMTRATCQHRGPGWLPRTGEAFLRELQELVQAGLPARMTPEHGYYGFRDAMRAWTALVGGDGPVPADSPAADAAIAAVRSATAILADDIKALLITAV